MGGGYNMPSIPSYTQTVEWQERAAGVLLQKYVLPEYALTVHIYRDVSSLKTLVLVHVKSLDGKKLWAVEESYWEGEPFPTNLIGAQLMLLAG